MKKIMLICFLFIINILIISQIVCSCSIIPAQTYISCNVKEDYFNSELNCLNEECSINITKLSSKYSFLLNHNDKEIYLQHFKDNNMIRFNLEEIIYSDYFEQNNISLKILNNICVENISKLNLDRNTDLEFYLIEGFESYFSPNINKINFKDSDEIICNNYNEYIFICAEETRLNKIDEIIDILIEDNHFLLSPLIKNFKNKKENFFNCHKNQIYIRINDDLITFKTNTNLKDYCYYLIQEFCFSSHPKVSHPLLFIHFLKNPNKDTIPYLLVYFFVLFLFICFLIFMIYLYKLRKLKSYFLFNKSFLKIYLSLSLIIFFILIFGFTFGYFFIHIVLFYIILIYILICFGNYFYKKYKKKKKN